MQLNYVKLKFKKEMGTYNNFPPFWERISSEEFGQLFFCYIFKPSEYRQMIYTPDGLRANKMLAAKLFEVSYSSWEGLGVAMTHEWVRTKKGTRWVIRFYKYGDPELWKINEQKFADQFRGDNS